MLSPTLNMFGNALVPPFCAPSKFPAPMFGEANPVTPVAKPQLPLTAEPATL